MTTDTMKRPAVHIAGFSASLRERWHEIRAQFARPELGFDWLRVYLGIGLVVRGALFAKDPTLIDQFLGNTSWFLPLLGAHALLLAHIVGGLMLALGCYTRLAAGIQLPFVAGAVFFVHWQEGLLAGSQSLEFSALVLVMLLAYTVCGAGEFSIDNYLRRTPPEVPTAEPALSLQRTLHAPRTSLPPGELAHTSVEDTEREPLQEELSGAHLDLPADPPYAKEQYRGIKRELWLLVVSLGVLFVLLAKGVYVAAAAWLIAALVIFTVWRIGQAQFD